MAGNLINIGQKFGRLTVVSRAPNSPKATNWFVRCECGNERVVAGPNLRNGHTRSCGCLSRELASARMQVWAVTHNMTDSPTWNTWCAMKSRCNDPGSRSYEWYGARGISVCERWNEFENFLADMGERPPGKTLDRWPNNDGNYEPGNCRWATKKQQALNRSDNSRVEFRGEVLTVTEWAERIGISRKTIFERLRRGWSAERALTEPLHLAKSPRADADRCMAAVRAMGRGA